MVRQVVVSRLIRMGMVAVGLAMAAPALANTLEAAPGAPLWMRLGAKLLWLHIGGGAVGMLSGTVAILAPKGRWVHRTAGKVFFAAMFTAYAIGAGVAPFLTDGQRPNFVAGILALCLLVTAGLAAWRRDPKTGAIEYASLAVELCVVAAGVLFMVQAGQDPSGTVDGSPPQAFILFIAVGAAAALGDAHVLFRRTITGVSRISRHLWRMCMSLFIASGSFFLGQQQVLPKAVVGTAAQFGPVLFPLAALVIWLVIEHLPKRAAALRGQSVRTVGTGLGPR